MKINILFVYYSLFFASLIFSGNNHVYAANQAKGIWPFKNKKEKTDNAPKDSVSVKETPYTKLFKGKKNVKTVKGLFAMHQVEDKLYLEFPVDVEKQDFILSSQLEDVSDIGVIHVGQRSSGTLYFTITKRDSTILFSRKNGLTIETSQDSPEIKEAIAKSNIPSVIYKTPVLAYTKDSLGVVIDVTSFFTGDNDYITSFNFKPKQDRTQIYNIEAFEDNVSVYSGMTIDESGQLVSFVVKSTISQLPDSKMDYFEADNRIGIASFDINSYENIEQGIKQKKIVRKWNLKPSDSRTLKKGQLVDPLKPIVFYVDTLFSSESFDGIKSGFEKWNQAFEKIGYKNVIRVLPYPKDDSTFNANNNIKYNCIKYVQTNQMMSSRNITRQIVSDPRTGEIMASSVYFPRDAFIPMHYQRVIQTGYADPTVRNNKLTKEQLTESMNAVMIKQAGYCLGLDDNLASSAWYDVDSLRSVAFTQKNGLAASVMDDVIYNYIAQPEDVSKGVKLVNSDLGVYDYYAIEWLYGKTDDIERSELVDYYKDDPRYLFIGKRVSNQVAEDPRAIIGTLGNDVIKSTSYGLKSCKYVMDNYVAWLDFPDTDESYLRLFPEFIFLETLSQLRHLIYPLGGIYVENEENNESFKSLSGKKQREIFQKALIAIEQISWINNKKAFKQSGLSYVDMTNPLIATPIVQIANRIPLVSVAASIDNGDNPFSPEELIGELTKFVTRKFREDGAVSQTDRRMLEWTIKSFASNVQKITSTGVSQSSQKASSQFTSFENIEGLNPQFKLDQSNNAIQLSNDEPFFDSSATSSYKSLDIFFAAVPDLTPIYYKQLKEIQKALNYKKISTSDVVLKGFCEFYSYKIQNVFKGGKLD